MEGAWKTQEKNTKLHCSVCLAEVDDGAVVCPKCGSTVFRGASNDAPLRNTLQFFSTPLPFYVKAKPPVVVNGELVTFETEWKLYRARLQLNAPSIFLWDRDGYLSGKQEAALHLVEGDDLAYVIASLPERKRRELRNILMDEWGLQVEDEKDLVNVVSGCPLFYQPVPRLRDLSILKNMDWRDYVERLACPKPGKDSKLVKVHLTKIPAPLSMHYAPHSLEVANSNTGKTRFYDAAGIKIDKATRKAVLGFAKSPVEVYPGTINGTTLPTAFDQIESQDSYELAKYMLDILETGRALVDSGGIRFVVETRSSFAYLGNPMAKDAKIIEGFKALLDHICANPAMGRRFSIILFATDLKTIKGAEKMTLQELEEWKRGFTLFRAVEEYAQHKLQKIINDPKVADWLHKPIKGYRETIYKATEELDDYNLAAFFESHAEAEHRVRGAALHAAVALLLDKIALDEVTIDDMLKEAEELLIQYVQINLESIATLCQMWDKLRVEQAVSYFENCPDYLREIISAVIHHKRSNPDVLSVNLEQIPYEPEDKTTYSYFSRCINKLKQRRKLDALNESIRNLFGFQIVNNNGRFTVEYFENPKPPEELKLIGKYGVFNHLTDLTISPLPQTPQHVSLQQGNNIEESMQPSVTQGSIQDKESDLSGNSVKWLKRLNGYGKNDDEQKSTSEKIEKSMMLRNGENDVASKLLKLFRAEHPQGFNNVEFYHFFVDVHGCAVKDAEALLKRLVEGGEVFGSYEGVWKWS